jgi:AcrR family transcriptional regulator
MIEEQDSIEVRDRIIQTARELFIKKGLKGTTVRDIATSSGTNVAMVNYYFQSKGNLFETIFDESFEILVGKVFSTINSDLPFFEIIRRWVYSYYDVLMENPQLPIFVLYELSQNPLGIEKKIREKNPQKVFDKLSVRMRAEVQKGTIRKIDMTDLLLNLVSLSIFPFVFRPIATAFINVSPDDYQALLAEHKESVVEFIINAIKITS